MRRIKSRQQEIEQAARDYHDHNIPDLPTLNKTLMATIEAVEETDIPYALIGGVAGKELGRPRITHDIDLFVRPDDAAQLLNVLKEKGFMTEKRDPNWLYKAWRDEVLVDIIFKSSGDIYFDEEIREHVRRIPYHGKWLNAISPEDFIIIKSAAHQENLPHHWHDALAVLKQGNIDWEYLFKRAKHAPRRILSLLLYATSIDIAIPNEIIQKLYKLLFEAPIYVPREHTRPYKTELPKSIASQERETPIYLKGRIMEALTCDGRIAEHHIKVIISDSIVVARGEVFTEEQRQAVSEVIHNIAPHLDIKNEVRVRIITGPEGSEAIQ